VVSEQKASNLAWADNVGQNPPDGGPAKPKSKQQIRRVQQRLVGHPFMFHYPVLERLMGSGCCTLFTKSCTWMRPPEKLHFVCTSFAFRSQIVANRLFCSFLLEPPPSL
jgi:hypothetical protein